MGSIAAVVDKKDLQAGVKAAKILESLKHRGSTHCYIIHNGGLIDLTDNHGYNLGKSIYALGFNANQKLDAETAIPYQRLVFDGEIYKKTVMRLDEAYRLISDAYSKTDLEKIIERFDGVYALALISDEGIFACHDPMGCKPLYYGSMCGTHALASERKGIWMLGIKDAYPVQPGSIIRMDDDIEISHVYKLVRPVSKIKDMEKAVTRTAELLKLAVSRRIDVSNEVALAFSGGVDSSIIAYLLKELGVDIKLYTLTIGERPETRQAIECAEMLGLPLEVLSKSEEDVKSLVGKALWLIEEPNILKLEIAIPILMVAQQVSRDGLKTLFLGQGGDELFAGYSRFNEIYRKHGEKGVEHKIYVNIMDSYLTNFQRDEPLLTSSGVSGRYPFYDLSLVNHALSISARLNLDIADGLRKGVLREAGKVLGLPTEICELPKRAIQYGSGVHKAIRKIALERGLDTSKFVKKEFEDLFHR